MHLPLCFPEGLEDSPFQCFSKVEIGVHFNKIMFAMELENTICCSVHDNLGRKKINELQDRT